MEIDPSSKYQVLKLKVIRQHLHGKLDDSRLAGLRKRIFCFASNDFSRFLQAVNKSVRSFGSSISSEKVEAGGTAWKVVFFPKGFTVFAFC